MILGMRYCVDSSTSLLVGVGYSSATNDLGGVHRDFVLDISEYRPAR